LKKIFHISIILLLFLEYGCTKIKSDLDGLWISAYQIQTEPNIGMVDYNKIMLIVGDSIFFNNTGEPKNDFNTSHFKTKFRRTSGAIIIEDAHSNLKIYVHEMTPDSLVLSYNTESSTREVYRKLKEPDSKIDWNPKNKSYQWKGTKSLVNSTFLENGLFVDYVEENEDISVGHWNTLDVMNNLFIILDKLFVEAVSVDSLTENMVYLSLYNKEKYQLSFKERKLEIPKNLLGNWTLVDSENISIETKRLPPSYKLPTLSFISIGKDSIYTKKNNVESTKKWTIGGANNLIIFPDAVINKDGIAWDTLVKKERNILRNIFKIESLSETKLEILIENEVRGYDGFDRKLIFTREKTKANKT
tara:strand:+ start:7311 stop:8390 length:1080 start_codon:yes stop_codon:yes gene_type:complete